MTRYAVTLSTFANTAVEVEADTPDEAKRLAEESDGFPTLCHQCSGGRHDLPLELGDEWNAVEVSVSYAPDIILSQKVRELLNPDRENLSDEMIVERLEELMAYKDADTPVPSEVMNAWGQVRQMVDEGGDMDTASIVSKLDERLDLAAAYDHIRGGAAARSLSCWGKVVERAERSPAFAPTSVDMAGAGDGAPELDDVVLEVVRRAFDSLTGSWGRTQLLLPELSSSIANDDTEIRTIAALSVYFGNFSEAARGRVARWVADRWA